MRKHVLATALAGAASALTVGLGAASAVAATATWTVTPGGKFISTDNSGRNQRLTDTSTGTEILCRDLQISGTFKSGTGLTNPVGRITSVGYNNFPGPYTCTVGPSSGPISVTFSPIGFRAVRYDATRGLTYGAFVGIHATFSGLSSFTCSGVLDGTSATAGNGLVRFKYLDSFGLLQTFLGGGNLHLYNVSGCGGLINSGDALTVRASFVLASHGRVNTITSP